MYNPSYSRFFLVDLDGNTSFWGDWEDLEESHERGSLEQDLFQDHKTGDDEDENEDSSSPAENGARPEQAPPVNGRRPISRPPGLLLLISSQVLSADHKERQDDVVTMLKSKKIAYLEVDGSVGIRYQKHKV